MNNWLSALRTEPPSWTPLERRFFWILTFCVAVTRFMAVAKSLWDWDEALFCTALGDYDVAAHHPHPPGFPLYVVAARFVHLFVASEFRALQVVVVAGAIALFPLMVFLCRELRTSYVTSIIAALLLVFFPNVWFFGGSAFSDVPSLALSIVAAGLLLRGCRSAPAYFAGALVLAIAAGFRPQNLLIGMVPSLLATWFRIRATRSIVQPLLAIAIGGAVVGGAYYGAAMATRDWATYREAVHAHQQYIVSVDSIANPRRPALWRVFDDFFVRPYRMKRLNVWIGILSALALLGALAGKRKPVLAALAIFGPFCVVGWMMLDVNSASRFSVAWAPLIALAAADGLAMVGRLISANPRASVTVQWAGAAFLVLTMITWTAPALRVVRRTESPPMQAVHWLYRNVPAGTPLFVHGSMGPFSDLLLTRYPTQFFGDEETPLAPSEAARRWIVREGRSELAGAHNFTYPHGRLWQMVRKRYFEVFVAPAASQVRYGEGWYDEEGSEHDTWRWMSGRSTLFLPAIATQGRLSLHCFVPMHALHGRPVFTVTFNGAVIDRFTPPENAFDRTYVVPSRASGWDELRIETTEIVNQAKEGTGADARDLGLRLESLLWSAAR